MATVMRSACLPASRLPIRSPRPSASAPPRVASSSACRAGSARGSIVATLCSSAAIRIASNMSRSLLLAAPSVPEPGAHARAPSTRAPRRCRWRASCCSRDCAPRRRRVWPASSCPRRRARRACAASDRPFQTPSDSRYCVGDCVMRVLDDLDLVLRLGQVDQQRHAVLVRQRARGLERRGRRPCRARAARPRA